jgi:hypothetical protein
MAAHGFFNRWVAVSICPLVFFLFALMASADATILDFEGLSGMYYHGGKPIPEISQLSDQLLSSPGVPFRSGSPCVAVVTLGLGHEFSGINGIGESTPAGIPTCAPANPIIAEFFDHSLPYLFHLPKCRHAQGRAGASHLGRRGSDIRPSPRISTGRGRSFPAPWKNQKTFKWEAICKN